MKRIVLCVIVLFWVFGCDGGSGGPTTPEQVPNIAGRWSGTYTVEIRGGSQCPPADRIEPGARTGDILNVTQDGRVIQLFQLTNCIICQLGGTISPDGSVTALGMIAGHTTTLRLEGQVSDSRLTATATVQGVDCDFHGLYDLTRG